MILKSTCLVGGLQVFGLGWVEVEENLKKRVYPKWTKNKLKNGTNTYMNEKYSDASYMENYPGMRFFISSARVVVKGRAFARPSR